MLLILSDNTDVYFNLAAEEYMLHHFTDDVLMLWQSKSAVVCGKHQNLCAELNYGFCIENAIQPARRLTGGGTVYHDLGNINFTFIQNIPEGLEKAINFKRFLDPVKAALQSMGVNAEYSQRNDLLLNGKKISGNAEHVFQKQKRVLHHGTLLFDADLKSLKNALHADGIYTHNAVKSVRSEVTNIKTALPNMSTIEFLENLYQYWASQQHTNRYVFCEKDVEIVKKLQKDKFSAESWIVHYSPRYDVIKKLRQNNQEIELLLRISDGIIEDISLIQIPAFNIETFKGQKISQALSLELQTMLNTQGISAPPFVLF